MFSKTVSDIAALCIHLHSLLRIVCVYYKSTLIKSFVVQSTVIQLPDWIASYIIYIQYTYIYICNMHIIYIILLSDA